MDKIIINDIEIDIIRKKIKNLYLKINREGLVTVTAPNRAKLTVIEEFVYSRLDWLNKHKTKIIESNHVLPKSKKYQTGEIFYFFGKKYTLKINEKNNHPSSDKVTISDNQYLEICNVDSMKNLSVEYLINKWYKEQLKIQSDIYFKKWQDIIGVSIFSYKIKNMKSRWGSCQYIDHKISLNFQLVKYPLQCLEYVIVHELVHLLEPSHNHRFKSLMTKYLPDWKIHSQILKNLRLV